MVPNQQVYMGRRPVISSSLANTPCSSLGIQGLLDKFNTTLGTSYTLDTPSVCSTLKDYISQKYDFGTAYGHLRKTWCDQSQQSTIQTELRECEARDIELQKRPLPKKPPRRVWDLCNNRVVPWWSCKAIFHLNDEQQPISHAWVNEVDRVDVWTPINGYEWPAPIPKGANLDLICIEMLNLGVEYTWLDVLCLRQKGGPSEDLRVEEWKMDVPTIGAIYISAFVVWYLSRLGLPLSLKKGDLDSDWSWFRRAWTAQEVGQRRTIAGDTPGGPLHAKPIDDTGNYADEILTKFHKQLKSVKITSTPKLCPLYGMLSMMQNRISTYPIDKVAGLAFSMETQSFSPYYECQSLEDAWTALVNVMNMSYRSTLVFTYPKPGTGCRKWRPLWEQVMTKSLPNLACWIKESIGRDDDDDCYQGLSIERGFVHGLMVGGVEGIDRCGKLVVEDAVGMSHTFNILASHQYPIPGDTYTLLGADPMIPLDGQILLSLQYWVVGRRLPNNMFEKVSVFKMTDSDEIQRLKEPDLSTRSRSILA
ncbi:hypothetical protein EDD18DRAFT_1342949 [Armillaria luteobubalina]|uniref:Heterokaryon incompatibility domain-containing protein n=1 Tax=Armillaria luteobubalina TaxID=153913 RepID=A0AA39QRT2_9AGAR|nr:hypothetical protein EDD18DRAFT_1342949 [Armillaria luteobubalina]